MRKSKLKLETLRYDYKLPSYIMSSGGNSIISNLMVMSRAQAKEVTKTVSHELTQDDEQENEAQTALGDMSLYWPSPYGLTSIDFFARDPSLNI